MITHHHDALCEKYDHECCPLPDDDNAHSFNDFHVHRPHERVWFAYIVMMGSAAQYRMAWGRREIRRHQRAS